MAIVGSDSSVGDTARVVTDISFAPSGCGLTGSGGTDFILEANPGLDYSLVITIVGFFDVFTVEGGLMGQLDWMVDSRTGTCRIDMDLNNTLDLTSTPPASTSFLEGEACEHELRLDVSDGVETGMAPHPKPRIRLSS